MASAESVGRRRQLAAVLWPLAIALLAAAAFSSRFSREMVDFEVYQRASARAAAAEPLYRPSDGHYQFKYLPAFALAMRPFAGLDPAIAKAVWFGLSVGFLGMLLRWSVRGLPERRHTERVLLWITFVLMAKFYAHELTLGQSNLLLGALLVSALLAVQARHPVAAGVLVGLAAFVKPYALILAPWLAVSHGAVAIVACACVLLTGLLLPVVVYGWMGNLSLLAGWWRTVSESTPANLLGADNISLAAMWAKWLGVGSAAQSLTLVIALALAVIVVVVCLDRGRLKSPEYLEIALLMLLVPLFSPQGWDYVLLLATPAVMLIVDRWRELSPGWKAFAAMALALMCLTIFDLMGRAAYGRFMALSIVSVAAIAVVIVLARLRWMRLA